MLISLEIVQTENGDNTLIGKGTVFLPIAGGIVQEAYHAPVFSSHISTAHPLSDYLEVVSKSTTSGRKICHLLKKGYFCLKDII